MTEQQSHNAYSNPMKENNMKRTLAVFTAVCASLMFVGCATPINVKTADSGTTSAAHSFTTKPGLAKIYFVGGQVKNAMYGLTLPGGAILLVDGNKVGQIDKNDVMVLDVLPKQYTFAWQNPPADAQMVIISRDVKAGDVVILRADLNTGGTGILPGFFPMKYEISELSERNAVMSKRVVSPTSCPPGICSNK